MALNRSADGRATARLAQREILLWTTRDGREIPLDEMSDAHIANAVRVLSAWRQRLKKRAGAVGGAVAARSAGGGAVAAGSAGGNDDAIVTDLAAAIARFKQIERRRRKATRDAGPETGERELRTHSSFGARAFRPRKPVAST